MDDLGAVSGSTSTRKFYVRGELPQELHKTFSKRIALRKFKPLVAEEEAEERFGWCGLGQASDLSPSHNSIFRDPYLTLGLRVDKYRFPSAVVNAKLQEATREKLKKEGGDKLSRPEAAELKARVMIDMRRQFLPTLKIVDMVWHLDRAEVQFWSHSKNLEETLCALFELTFGMELVANSPYIAARQIITDKPRLAALEAAEVTAVHGS